MRLNSRQPSLWPPKAIGLLRTTKQGRTGGQLRAKAGLRSGEEENILTEAPVCSLMA